MKLKRSKRPSISSTWMEPNASILGTFVEPCRLNLRRNQVVVRMLSDLERQGAKPLDFNGFLDLMTAKMGERDTKEDVSKVFRLFDDDRSGTISVRNLQRVARELGEQLEVTDLEEMIARADTDGDGQVSLDDFYSLMTRKTFPH